MATICPVCKQKMVTLNAGRGHVEFCRLGCKGLWLDGRQLRQISTATAVVTTAIAEALAASPRMRGYEILKCPTCAIPLQLQAYQQTGVFIDRCYRCGGCFLDAGELAEISHDLAGKRDAEAEAVRRRNLRLPPVPPPERPLRKLTPAERRARGYLWDGIERPQMTGTEAVLWSALLMAGAPALVALAANQQPATQGDLLALSLWNARRRNDEDES